MESKVEFALVYIRNGRETVFPVKDIDHAVRIADSIADSDLLNDAVDFNAFDVCRYQNGRLGEGWESKDGKEFNDYWREIRTP